MTDLSKLTAKDFSDAMHRGYHDKEWCDETFYKNADGLASLPSEASSICAVGAMAIHLESFGFEIARHLNAIEEGLFSQVSDASDRAGNKRAAMKAVDAILLRSTPDGSA